MSVSLISNNCVVIQYIVGRLTLLSFKHLDFNLKSLENWGHTLRTHELIFDSLALQPTKRSDDTADYCLGYVSGMWNQIGF